MKRAILAALAATALVAAALAAVVSGGPSPSAAADHVDAPGLTPPGGNLQLDLTDVYAWRASNGNTVLAMNVNGLTAPGMRPVFASGVPNVSKTKAANYWFRIDSDGDAVSDVDLRISFGKPNKAGVQNLTVTRNGERLLKGKTSAGKAVTINREGAVRAYAGLRDDPFFFDLDGYINILSNEAGKSFLGCKSPRTDFFAKRNVSSIVLELPASLLRGARRRSACGRRPRSGPSRSTAWGGRRSTRCSSRRIRSRRARHPGRTSSTPRSRERQGALAR